MSSANTLIVFGATPDAYFVGHGRRFFIENMPPGFTEHVKERMNISMTTWISINNVTSSWMCFDVATDNFTFSAATNQDIRNNLSGVNGADFVTYPHTADRSHYVLKGKQSGTYNAVLDDAVIKRILDVKQGVGANFDVAFQGMLFGKGDTSIMMFSGGYFVTLDEEVKKAGDAHPLVEVLSQYNSSEWSVQKGSTLCS
ncbi:hypothetical protein MKEN_00897700 [Mycena kentingensis (nom. inval.)]|nr:hypothetical protein MKEN_00897700 [Mycena kentingensis (nom. inval.)]